MTDTPELPVAVADAEAPPPAGPTMPPSMAIWFDDRLFERAKLIAKYLSEAAGFVPPHLIGKPQACFAVVERALTWRLSPYAVAQSTYQTPGGRVGYEGKLCQAILEVSGRLEGGVTFKHYGDWSRVKGKFELKKSDKGKDYPVPTWKRADAAGLGVIVRAQVKGENAPRELDFPLDEAFPLNSTLWATSPKRQICYTAVRAFAALAVPGLFMGVPFDREDDVPLRDVTPPKRPERADFIDTSLDPASPVAAHDPATGELIDRDAAAHMAGIANESSPAKTTAADAAAAKAAAGPAMDFHLILPATLTTQSWADHRDDLIDLLRDYRGRATAIESANRREIAMSPHRMQIAAALAKARSEADQAEPLGAG